MQDPWKTDNNNIYQVDGSISFNFGKLIIASNVNVLFFSIEYKRLFNNTAFVIKDQTKPSVNSFSGNFKKLFITYDK